VQLDCSVETTAGTAGGDLRSIAVLFARSDSIYKSFPATDVFDLVRDARTWRGGCPVVAHPPCRGWGRLASFAKVQPGELDLGHFAVEQVRRCGGVLEHPHASRLWRAAGLPVPGERDAWGGWTLPVYQGHFGHRAPKATWLYVVGVAPVEIPGIPFDLVFPSGRVELMGRSEREATPPAFAAWLLDLARRVS
jgi:hypothetical protein